MKMKDVRQFLTQHEVVSRLDCREGFYGGRTNASLLKYQVKGNEKIKYIDFTFLYPYTNKYCEYPVGHPVIITMDFQDISAYFGFIKCLILPPRGLYHPVLPYRSTVELGYNDLGYNETSVITTKNAWSRPKAHKICEI